MITYIFGSFANLFCFTDLCKRIYLTEAFKSVWGKEKELKSIVYNTCQVLQNLLMHFNDTTFNKLY